MAKRYQIAAIPVRRRSDGGTEVLLVTSRETRRWVVPKGWPWRKIKDRDAAAGEAWEEAGVRGVISAKSVGKFVYDKRRRDKSKTLEVRAYVLEVTEEAAEWPEAAERQRTWFAAAEAAELVDEPGLQKILAGLAD